jgi:hypothetical protein
LQITPTNGKQGLAALLTKKQQETFDQIQADSTIRVRTNRKKKNSVGI